MVRMPSAALMESLFVGATGVRTLTCWTRRGGEGALESSSWSAKIAGRGATLVRSKVNTIGMSLRSLNSFAPSMATVSSSFSHQLQRSGVSTMVASALNRAADVALDPSMMSLDEMDKFEEVANELADAAGDVIRQLFRTKFDIVDKDDASPVTVADRRAERAMNLLIRQHFPSHGIYGEEGGLQMPDELAEYVWVLDPIDGTKSFITGKPLFGTLIALIHKGVPVLGIIDQPILRERWIGRAGKGTTLNGQPISSRSTTTALKDAYLYTTSPHFFAGSAEASFIRVRDKVKTPLYGCDCYAYGLLAAGFADLVVESGLKPYDFLALVPVIEGAGGFITDWGGRSLRFWPNSEYPSVGTGEVVAAGSAALHKAAVSELDWK